MRGPSTYGTSTGKARAWQSQPVDRVRVGIIGVGNIATLNVPGYLEHEQCELVALCDPRPDVLERRQREWNVPRVYPAARSSARA